MKQSKDFAKKEENIMWRLQKTLYGTVHGSYDWFKTLSHTYRELHYKQLQAKPMIHTQYNRENFTIIYTYIGDTISSLSDKKKAKQAKKRLEKCYNVKTMMKVDHILDIKIEKVKKDL